MIIRIIWQCMQWRRKHNTMHLTYGKSTRRKKRIVSNRILKSTEAGTFSLQKLGHRDMILTSEQFFEKVSSNNCVKSTFKKTIYASTNEIRRNSERELSYLHLAPHHFQKRNQSWWTLRLRDTLTFATKLFNQPRSAFLVLFLFWWYYETPIWLQNTFWKHTKEKNDINKTH